MPTEYNGSPSLMCSTSDPEGCHFISNKVKEPKATVVLVEGDDDDDEQLRVRL